MSRFVLAMLLVCLTASAHAATAATPNIATINLSKVFDNYYKTKQATGILKDEMEGMDKELKGMLADFEKAKADYQKLRTSAEDSAVSGDESKKRKQAAEDKLKYLRDQDESISSFKRQVNSNMEEKKMRMTDRLLAEIREVIKAKAKAANYTLVLDSGETTGRAPVVLFTTGDNDITADVIDQLNAGAPSSDAAKPADLPAEKKDDKKK